VRYRTFSPSTYARVSCSALSTTPFSLSRPPPPRPTLFPYTTLFRSELLGQLKGRKHLITGNNDGPATLAHPFAASVAGPSLLPRSEEHTSELQSRENLVCRLLLEKKKKKNKSRDTKSRKQSSDVAAQ